MTGGLSALEVRISWLRTSTVEFRGPLNATIPSKAPGTGAPLDSRSSKFWTTR